jgi:SAM-dependent methyltransferase
MIKAKICEICNKPTIYTYGIKEPNGSEGLWYACTCGVIFQNEFKPVYEKPDLEETEPNQKHAVNVYAPIIEELTYGRQLLQVEYERSPEVMKEFESRGWITWGIDERSVNPGKNFYKGDFLFYPFTPQIKDKQIAEELEGQKRRFDLIWIQDHLERQHSPLKVLQRAYELLDTTGVLYISTPEIDFIYNEGVRDWIHWKAKDYNFLWSERALVREIERIGFKVVMSRKNSSVRFTRHYETHIVAQK